MRIGELFAGGGGWISRLSSEYTPTWAIEHNEKIADVYRLNHGNHVIPASVADINPGDLSDIDLLIASPPCQAYSKARNSALPARRDADIGLKVIDFLRVIRPKHFLLENVPPYVYSETFKAICACLSDLGYFYSYSNLNAADYGVPQTRLRLVLRASRQLLPPLPTQTARQALWPVISDLQHEFVKVNRLTKHLQARLDHNFDKIPMYLSGKDTNLCVRGLNEPAFTIVASCANGIPIVILESGYYRISIRALARLQTFPDTYILPKSRQIACTVIGNAVPPLLGKALISQFQ